MNSRLKIWESLLEIEKQQCNLLSTLDFGENVSYIYNPLDYAKETHVFFVRSYCNGPKTVLFLGMNPGPFGMAQNGVPFGDTTFVNDWLKIQGTVYKPQNEHPKRQIEGLNCSRSEVSGSRFWSFIQDTCGTPENFFRNCYVHNYCPISMMTQTARNVTPADLKAFERKILLETCDASLFKVIQLLQVLVVVGIGRFAEERANKVVKSFNLQGVTVVGLMHPSPINPAANKGWKEVARAQLEAADVLRFMV